MNLCACAALVYASQLVPSGRHCFAIDQTSVPKNCTVAANYCTTNGADYLAMVYSAAEASALAGAAAAVTGVDDRSDTANCPAAYVNSQPDIYFVNNDWRATDKSAWLGSIVTSSTSSAVTSRSGTCTFALIYPRTRLLRALLLLIFSMSTPTDDTIRNCDWARHSVAAVSHPFMWAKSVYESHSECRL